MAPPSSTLAWKIPWTEEPGGLQSMGLLTVGHDWVTSLSLFTFMHWRRKWQPTPVFLPGESQGWGSLAGCRLWGRTESDTTEATYQQQQHSTSIPFWKSFWISPTCLEPWTLLVSLFQSPNLLIFPKLISCLCICNALDGRICLIILPYMITCFLMISSADSTGCLICCTNFYVLGSCDSHKWRRKWQPTPVFLPRKSCGQRSLAGYSTQGHRKSDKT